MNKERETCIGNYVIGGLLVLYGCCGVNIVVGLAGAAYCGLKEKFEEKSQEKRIWKDMRKAWLVSCVPVGGPLFAFLMHAMRGLGN